MKTKILITNLTTKNDGFGVDPETGEGVYIPPGVTLAAKLVAGEYRWANLVPNAPGRSVPYLAAFIDPVGTKPEQIELPLEPEPEPKPEQGVPSTEDRIMDMLEATETYYTTGEIAEHLGVSASGVRDHLDKLFTLEKVARADIFYKSRIRAKTVLWATEPNKFL